MKRVLLLFLFFSILKVNGQNEFAATAFYKDFQKIYADAKNGFSNYLGILRKSNLDELTNEYNVKLLLPLADSGKIVISENTAPYVIYYFEPDKMRLKVDQRGANLRDAVLNILGKEVIARSETTLVNNRPKTNTWYFIDPNEKRLAFADFRMTIYFQNGKYNLAFEIRGKAK